MKQSAIAIAGLLSVAMAEPSLAGAWTQPKGQGQVIIKYEDMRADRAFDQTGQRVDLIGGRRDRSIGGFAEYGLTDDLTLQLKGDWQSGRDAFIDYEGRGPLEVGVTWQAWRDDRTAVSVYGGYASGGEGRNAGYAAPGVGDDDWEVRASVGRSFGAGQGGGNPRWMPGRSFIEVQAARRMRDGLPDETRADVTLGGHFGDDWLVLGQAYGGITDGDQARWLSLEASIVRNLGDWSLQAGWREAVAGRETPQSRGPIVAVWRRF